MKKTLTVALTVLLLLLLSACSAEKPDYAALELARRDSGESPVQGEIIAVACGVNSPLGGLEFVCAPEGGPSQITVSIYAADTDYNTTVSASPQREKTFDDLSAKMLWQFNPLPAGDYLIVFSERQNASLLKSVVPSDEANGKILHYRNGEIMTDGTCSLTLLCIKTETDPEPGIVTFAYPVVQE